MMHTYQMILISIFKNVNQDTSIKQFKKNANNVHKIVSFAFPKLLALNAKAHFIKQQYLSKKVYIRAKNVIIDVTNALGELTLIVIYASTKN